MKKYLKKAVALLLAATILLPAMPAYANFHDKVAVQKVVEKTGAYFVDASGTKLVSTWVLYNGNKLYVNENGTILTNTKTPDGYVVDKFGREVGTYMYNQYKVVKSNVAQTFSQKNIAIFKMPVNMKDPAINEAYVDAYLSITGALSCNSQYIYYENKPEEILLEPNELKNAIASRVELDKAIQEYIKDFKGTNYEIFYQALDKMAATSTYDPNYSSSAPTCGVYNNPISALTKEHSQCHGYSAAIYEIGKHLGIEGITRVIGFMYEKGTQPTKTDGHEWISFIENGQTVVIDMTFPTGHGSKFPYRLDDPKNREMNEHNQRKVTYRIGKKLG